jgi:hypothetical protein
VISRPTTPQLIEATCAELESKVGPALGEGATKVALEMAVAVLRGAAVRSANELAWMREEADAVEAAADRLVQQLPDATGLATALTAYRDGKTGSLYLDDAQRDYDRAGEVLSTAAEAVYADGDAGRIAEVGKLFEQRMANENAVIGEFRAAGRS